MTDLAGPRAAPADAGAATCAYRGLLPFSEQDAPYFFGRTDDVRIISANLMAARLTLLYAPSGVGKTSVLRAGVVDELLELTDEFLPVVVREWSGDTVTAVDAAIAEAARSLLDAAPPEGRDGLELVDLVRGWWLHLDRVLLLIFDQFEEFLLYHGDDWDADGDARQMARLLGAREPGWDILLGLREDALASLDRFKGMVPHLFDNYLRLAQLDTTCAREAIEGPIERWSEEHPHDRMTIEPGLADAVIDQVATGRIALGRTGAGAAGAGSEGVETPFLQLVLERLWQEERSAGSHTLTLATLERLGGAAEMVRNHLDVRMRRLSRRKRDIAAAAFHQLVTPSGTKVARSVRDLAGYTDYSAAEIEPVLRTLARGDWSILRPVGEGQEEEATFEALHDVLAEAMLDWRARHEEARRRRRLRRRALIVAGISIAVVAAALLLVASFARQRDEAEGNAALARSRNALGLVPRDAVREALTAVDRLGPEAVPALRAAVAQSDLQGVVRMPKGIVQSLRLSPDGRRLAAAAQDGTVLVWTLGTSQPPLRLHPKTAARSVVFSPDGTRVATAGLGPDVEVWRVRDGKRVAGVSIGAQGAEAVRWSPRGDRLLTYVHDARVFDLGTGDSKTLGSYDLAEWSPGGSRIVTASGEEAVVWGADGSRLGSVDAGAPIAAVGFTADGGDVLLARTDGRVIRDGRDCPSRGRPLEWAGFTRDGRYLVALDAVSIRTVALADCEERRFARPEDSGQVAISSNGRLVVAVARDGAARVWDRPSEQQLATLIGNWPTRARLLMRPGADGAEVIFTAGNDGLVREWVVGTQPVARLADDAGVRAAAFDQTGRTVLVAGRRGVGRVDWRAGGEVEPVGDRRALDDAVFSADGTTVAATGPQGVAVMRLPDGAWTAIGDEDRGNPKSLAVSPHGSRVAIGREDGTVEIRDTDTGALVRSIGRGGRVPPYAGFTGDGRGVVVVGRSGGRVIDRPGGRPRTLARLGAAPVNRRVPAPFAARGPFVAVVAKDSQPRVYDLRDGRATTLRGARLRVDAMAFSPGGEVLATAGPDGVRLWDRASGELLTVLAAGPPAFRSLAFSPDGRWILASGPAAAAQVLPCRPCGDDASVRRAAEALLDGKLLPAAPLPKPPGDAPFSQPRHDESEPTAPVDTSPDGPVPSGSSGGAGGGGGSGGSGGGAGGGGGGAGEPLLTVPVPAAPALTPQPAPVPALPRRAPAPQEGGAGDSLDAAGG